ncbi:hypothetical protein SteCoe_26032 [Stentor coeruleus]|uniref:Phorbol-ester/DAG-type domain-containing protein n=1 Tax=Stentor coeruleus TaxID=5963 RepID=A0A1R2BDV0_9CILI|nr:hypothetical protein SteCoe_26032 [Stentor coeruleus]
MWNAHDKLFSNHQRVCQYALVRKENSKIRKNFLNDKLQQTLLLFNEITKQVEYSQNKVDEDENKYNILSSDLSELCKILDDEKFDLISSEEKCENSHITFSELNNQKDLILEKTVSEQKCYIKNRNNFLSYQKKCASLEKHYKKALSILKNNEESYEKAFEEKKIYNINFPILEQDNEILIKEVDQLQKRMEIYEEIVRIKKDVRCVVCNGIESGRMKKCIGCGVLAHSKCTNELKFRCIACKD